MKYGILYFFFEFLNFYFYCFMFVYGFFKYLKLDNEKLLFDKLFLLLVIKNFFVN